MRTDGDGSGTDQVVGPPRWVKVFEVVAIVVVAVFAIMLLIGHHGPGRHLRSPDGGESSHPPPTGQNEHRP
jgi:hypothetical protein